VLTRLNSSMSVIQTKGVLFILEDFLPDNSEFRLTCMVKGPKVFGKTAIFFNTLVPILNLNFTVFPPEGLGYQTNFNFTVTSSSLSSFACNFGISSSSSSQTLLRASSFSQQSLSKSFYLQGSSSPLIAFAQCTDV